MQTIYQINTASSAVCLTSHVNHKGEVYHGMFYELVKVSHFAHTLTIHDVITLLIDLGDHRMELSQQTLYKLLTALNVLLIHCQFT